MDEFEKWLVAKATGEFTDCDLGDNPKVIYKCGFIDGMLDRAKLTLNKYRSMTCKMELKGFGGDCWKCSVCGHSSYVLNVPKFCPNCGRKVIPIM